MALFTINEALEAALFATKATTLTLDSAVEKFIITESSSQKAVKQFDIFLSHAYTDKNIVIGIYYILIQMKYSVYVDWIHDPQLDRNQINTSTAETLRKRMKQSNSLFYTTTKSHSTSRWMPWEYGFYDGFDGHVAIMPVMEYSYSTFKGQEYLGLYPYSEKSTGYNRSSLLIVNQKNTSSKVTFDDWLAGKNP
jgi:hypothetical protein